MLKSIFHPHKKKVMLFLMSMVLIFSINGGAVSAYTYESCNTTVYWCQKLTLTGDEVGYSAMLSVLSAAEEIYYQWQNDGSTHGVGVGLYKSAGAEGTAGDILVDSFTAAADDGNGYEFVDVGAGQYYIRALCGGFGGCEGSGFLRYEK